MVTPAKGALLFGAFFHLKGVLPMRRCLTLSQSLETFGAFFHDDEFVFVPQYTYDLTRAIITSRNPS